MASDLLRSVVDGPGTTTGHLSLADLSQEKSELESSGTALAAEVPVNMLLAGATQQSNRRLQNKALTRREFEGKRTEGTYSNSVASSGSGGSDHSQAGPSLHHVIWGGIDSQGTDSSSRSFDSRGSGSRDVNENCRKVLSDVEFLNKSDSSSCGSLMGTSSREPLEPLVGRLRDCRLQEGKILQNRAKRVCKKDSQASITISSGSSDTFFSATDQSESSIDLDDVAPKINATDQSENSRSLNDVTPKTRIKGQSESSRNLDDIEVLRLELGDLPSVGSREHDSNACKPCIYVHSWLGCKDGLACHFCHYRHKSTNRPCKAKRERFWRLIRQREKDEEDGLEGALKVCWEECGAHAATGSGGTQQVPDAGQLAQSDVKAAEVDENIMATEQSFVTYQ